MQFHWNSNFNGHQKFEFYSKIIANIEKVKELFLKIKKAVNFANSSLKRQTENQSNNKSSLLTQKQAQLHQNV